EREIGFDRSAYFRWAVEVDVKAAVLQLACKDAGHCTVDLRPGRRTPFPVDRWMKPKLHHDVVGFKCAVSPKVSPPEALWSQALQEGRGCLSCGIRCGVVQ